MPAAPRLARPSDEPAGQELFLFRLNKLASVAGQPLIRLCEGRYGITRREWRLIVTLGRHGPLLSTQLALHAQLDAARTSRAVTLLVEKGLASRLRRPGDRRYVDIHLTEAGQAIFAELLPVVQRINEQLLSGLSAAERRTFDQLFAKLEASAGGMPIFDELPKGDRRRKGR